MPLTSKLKILISSFLLFFSMEIYANDIIPPKKVLENKVLEHYFLKVKHSYDKLNTKVEECHKEGKSNTFTSFDYENINLKNIDKFKFIFYIYFKNKDSCSKEEFKDLSYNMLILRSLFNKYDAKLNIYLDTIMNIVTVPSPMEERLKTELAYKKLPNKTKQYLEKTLGSRPFNARPFMDKQTEEYKKERKLRIKK